MDTNQPTATTTSYAPRSAAPGMFGTNIPSSVAFAVGILLFLMPFAELKCVSESNKNDKDGFDISFNSSALKATNTGLGLAMGKDWKIQMGGLGSLLGDRMKSLGKDQPKQKPNMYAIAALALGVIGFVFCFIEKKLGGTVGLVAGLFAAGVLIGLMFDLKSKVKVPIPGKGAVNGLFGETGDAALKLGFTPWYYVAVAAFLAAAVFCYQRMRSIKT